MEKRTWRTKRDRFITLTEFAKGKFIAAGLPADKVAVKPNFVADSAAKRESGWYETFGLVIVVALATALPIIASRLGAMSEIIEDGDTGLLFEPGDAADLAAKVGWAADNPSEMRRMGENAGRV